MAGTALGEADLYSPAPTDIPLLPASREILFHGRQPGAESSVCVTVCRRTQEGGGWTSSPGGYGATLSLRGQQLELVDRGHSTPSQGDCCRVGSRSIVLM